MAPPPSIAIMILPAHAARTETTSRSNDIVPAPGASNLVSAAIAFTVSENNVVYTIELLEVDEQTF